MAAAVSALVTAIGGAAVADPSSTPSLDTLVGANCPQLFDNGNPGGQAGTLVHDYNATHPAYPGACWDPVNPANGLPGQTITTKALNSSDTSCDLTRPFGSNTGIAALDQYQKDVNEDVYCLDFVFSALPPTTTTDEDAFVELAWDGMAWSYPNVKGETNPQPKSLSWSDLGPVSWIMEPGPSARS